MEKPTKWIQPLEKCKIVLAFFRTGQYTCYMLIFCCRTRGTNIISGWNVSQNFKGGKALSIYGISDLHLSFGTNKPMNIFKGWENHTERISANWKRLVKSSDTVILPGDFSWGQETLRRNSRQDILKKRSCLFFYRIGNFVPIR